MKLNLTFAVVLFLISVAVHCADPDPVAKKNTNDGLGSETTTTTATTTISNPKVNLNEKSTESGSNLESKQADPLEKTNVSNEIQNPTVDKTKTVPNNPLGDKEAGNMQKDSKDKEVVKDVEKKIKPDKGAELENVPKEDKLPSMTKGSFGGEQCDSSFKCTIGNDENHAMVACLSVPGDESTEVSLLIQNKGKGTLDVDITAPEFVRLDKTKIQIQENDDQKVMVSIGDGKTEKFITLKTLKGSCNLDFMDFLTHNPMKKSNYISQLTFSNLLKRTPFLGLLLSLAFVLVIVSVVVCVTYQRRRFMNNGTKYQKLDSGLPVSGGPKIDFDQKDGWNDNWSDGWDDVEAQAPSTPSMPLTPSISSAGVSSRRVNKDAWKD